MELARTPRQERSRQTHEALIDAAEALGIEKTYDQISVQEIASRAGYTIGAFYARFPSKGALLHALMHRYETMIDESRGRLATFDSNDQLVSHLASAFVKAYRSHAGRFRLLESAVSTDSSLAAKAEEIRVAVLDFTIDTLGRAYPLPRHDLETAALLLVMPLRELHFKREFWPKKDADSAALTEGVVDAVVAFLKARTAALPKSTQGPTSANKEQA